MDYDDSEFDLLFEEMDCRLLDADHIFPAVVPRIPRTPLTLPPMCSFIREFLFKSLPPFLGRQPWSKRPMQHFWANLLLERRAVQSTRPQGSLIAPRLAGVDCQVKAGVFRNLQSWEKRLRPLSALRCRAFPISLDRSEPERSIVGVSEMSLKRKLASYSIRPTK